MRLAATFEKESEALLFSHFLTEQGIANQCDGDTTNYHIWVIDEDHFATALLWLERYRTDPSQIKVSAPTSKDTPKKPRAPTQIRKRNLLTRKQALKGLSLVLVVLCSGLFFAQVMTEPPVSPSQVSGSTLPIPDPALLSPVESALLYDYPKAYTLLEQLYQIYPIEEIENQGARPSEMQSLLNKIQSTPSFQGYYPLLMAKLKGAAPPNAGATTFEKIRQGEIWRVFTPCLLHGDLLHILFNMLWLIALGPQIEERLGLMRYALFILLSACFTNTLQYLVSGPNFLGFSGVICAMIGFIWMRQKRAAWEGYLLHRSTLLFVALFVLSMLLLQIAATVYELVGNAPFAISIANTAHIAGGLFGIALGATNWFAWRPQARR